MYWKEREKQMIHLYVQIEKHIILTLTHSHTHTHTLTLAVGKKSFPGVYGRAPTRTVALLCIETKVVLTVVV
jgi:hypothetical protein